MNRRILFDLGQIVITRGALEVLNNEDVINALTRHRNGDWGDVCEEDKKLNNEAITYGNRILSAYTSSAGIRFWIITEHDRSYTTILLPEEY